jgi:hypothetical protein
MAVGLRDVDYKARFQVLTAMLLKIPVRKNVMMCELQVGTA